MKLEEIKLNNLAKNSLANREMRDLKGGKSCQCSCCYAGSGGSSTTDNENANATNGYHSTCDPHIELEDLEVFP